MWTVLIRARAISTSASLETGTPVEQCPRRKKILQLSSFFTCVNMKRHFTHISDDYDSHLGDDAVEILLGRILVNRFVSVLSLRMLSVHSTWKPGVRANELFS